MADQLFVIQVPVTGDYPDVHRLSDRARGTAASLQAGGTPVRFVRSVYVPEDGTCLLVFAGPDMEAVELVAKSLGLAATQAVTAIAPR